LGHKDETLKQTLHPNIIRRHIVTHFPNCNDTLSPESLTAIVKRQVFDIPPLKIEVTEHQAEVKFCTCCNKMVMAQFPENIRAPVQYGEVIRAWAVYYQHQHFIPEDRLQQLFSDLYDIHHANATLTRCSQIAFDTLAPFKRLCYRWSNWLLLKILMKRDSVLLVKHSSGYMWYQLKQQPIITYHLNVNHYLTACAVRWCMIIGKHIIIYQGCCMDFVINITCGN